MTMGHTREQIAAWLDAYFEAANDLQGPIESVAELRKYFADDFQFWMFTPPPFFTPPLSRDELLMTFVHPGIHERLTPKYYVIDLETFVAVVQFELCFTHKASGRSWRPLQASAHYHLHAGDGGEIKIARINYWTESHRPEDDYEPLFDLWTKDKEDALAAFGTKRLRGEV
ncbi:MAG: hypothetical protein M1274_07440 [Actinobacteria bacterium]|nr:hypothetical protein [Actinomycetota bacterium]